MTDDDLDDEGGLDWTPDDTAPDAGPYGTTAHTYLAAGWAPLPLPPRRKVPPPDGWTGGGAPWPSAADVQAWIDERGSRNIALRLPPTVLGIDMDCWHDKPGAATIAEHEARLGPLPATWSSTSRTDGSRIRFYRIPEGLAWPSVLPGGGVETIRTGHRYAVAWPSIHPDTGGTYRWANPDGVTVDTIPTVGDLAVLPAAWVDGLTLGRAAADIARAGLDASAAAAWIGGADQPCPTMSAATAKACTELTTPGASRHDAAVRTVQWLAHLAAEGHRGLAVSLRAVEASFTIAVGQDRDRDATAEWGRLAHGAIDIAAAAGRDRRLGDPCSNPFSAHRTATPSKGSPPWTSSAPLPGQRQTSTAGGTTSPSASPSTTPTSKLGPTMTAPSTSSVPTELATASAPSPSVPSPPSSGPASAPPSSPTTSAPDVSSFSPTASAPAAGGSSEADARERTSWWPRDLTPVIRGDITRPPCTSLHRSDGVPLWYPGRVNGLLAPSESGKTWVALLAVLQHLQAGEDVLALDMEDSAPGFVGRLRRMGATDEHLSHLTYLDPDESLHDLATADLYDVMRAGPYGLVMLDGVNAAMSLLGLKINDNNDATAFAQRLLKPFARTGSVVAVVDHTPKSEDPENMSRGAIGAQAKRAAMTGCALRVVVKKQPAPGEIGRLTLNIDKDREGSARLASKGGKWAGTAVIEDTDAGLVVVRIEPPEGGSAAGADEFKPTAYMERVSRWLETFGIGGASKTTLAKEVTGKAEWIRLAAERLAEDGYARVTAGSKGPLYHHSKPFREADTPSQAAPRPTPSHPVPTPSRDGVADDIPHPVHPVPNPLRSRVGTGDGDGVGDEASDGVTPSRSRTGLIAITSGSYLDPRTGEMFDSADVA